MCACRAPWGWSQRERALLPEAGQPTPACDGDVIPAASASVEVPGPGSGRGRGGPGSRGGRWAHRGAQATGADSPGRSGALGACIPHLESGPWPPPAGWRRGCSERMSGVPTARERARWHARSVPGIRNVPQGATRYLARLHAAAQLPPRRRPPPTPSPSSPPAARLQSVHEEASRASCQKTHSPGRRCPGQVPVCLNQSRKPFKGASRTRMERFVFFSRRRRRRQQRGSVRLHETHKKLFVPAEAGEKK